MPKHRNKNRNRNKNKQRTRQQQQEQQQQEKQTEENCNKESASSLATPSLETPPHPIAGQLVANSTEICLEKHVSNVDKIANEKPDGSNAVDANQQALGKVPDITAVIIAKETESKSVAAPTETNDTVLYEPSRCDNNIGNKHVDNVGANMGNEKSKIINNEKHSISSQIVDVLHNTNQIGTNVTAITPSSSPLGKVIVHRIVCEDSSSGKTKQDQPPIINQVTSTTAALSTTSDGKEAITSASSVKEHFLKNGNEQEQKVIATATKTTDNVNKILESDIKVPGYGSKIIVHKVFTDEDGYEKQPDSSQLSQELVRKKREEKHEENNESLNYIIRKDISNNESELKQLPHKVMVHKIVSSADDNKKEENKREDKIIQEKVYAEESINKLSDNSDNIYKDSPVEKVEPDVIQQQSKVIVHQILLEDKDEMPKITSPTMKEPVLSIAKPTTSEVSIVEISDENLSDLEELRSPVVSEAESSIEYSDENQKISESITEVSSSSSYSTTPTTPKQSRKQKRIALEHHFLPQMLNPRFLDSISEENSELSDNSENPLSRSVSSESSTNCPTEGRAQKLNAKFPKSSLDFSKPHKQQSTRNRKSKVIREETVAVAVAARLHDVPNADESCSTVRSCMSPEAQAAEVVFINSASSSVSDLHDLELFENVHTATPEITFGGDSKDIISKKTENNICYESLTSSPPQCTSAFTAKITEQQLPEFCANQNNSYNNNQTINNNKLVNNSTAQTPHIPATTDTVSKTRSLAEIDTNLNANFLTDSILVSSLPSSPATDQLVFAQIEEQISSVLSSINEIASQHTTTATITPKITSSSSSPPPPPPTPTLSSSLSSSTYLNIHTNLSNTQKLPVTTKSTTATTRTLQNSCEESFKAISGSSLCAANNAKTSRSFPREANMNTVRDIIINNNGNGNGNTVKANGNNANSVANGCVKLNYNYSNTFYPITSPRGSPPPPPIPPPSREHEQEQCLDECDNKLDSALPPSISTTSFALPLLQKNLDYHDSQTQSLHATSQDLKTALSQLTSSITRQKSMDSHCSDSTNLSQCTAINVATDQSDKSDSVQASLISDLKHNFIQQSQPSDKSCISTADPKKLRLLCAETLSTFPYGDTVLEELATIAQNIGEARALKDVNSGESMPYPLPELPHIDDLQLSLKVGKTAPDRPQLPIQDPDQSWLGVPTTHDPKVLVCLSPSQRSYIQQKSEQKPDDLLDAHQKFVERRGYHEYTKEQLEHLEREKLAEKQLLETAALMKKLRKSITPPPPQIPPPPVPVKSSETASKAKNLSKRTVTTAQINDTQQPSNDVNLSNDNEQMPAATNGANDGEENKHRLLSIMQDTNESNANTQKHSAAALSSTSSSSSSSAYENNSRQTTNDVSVPGPEQESPSATSIFSKDFLKNSYQFIHFPADKTASTMQSVEKTLGQMFPSIGSTNIFDQKNKRFSNIESSNAEPFCSQIMNTHPKRYSSIETHCYEAQKRIENGTVVQDFSTTKHESETSGNKSDQFSSFPVKTSLFKDESNSFMPAGKEEDKSAHYRNKQEIMSALNLTKHTSDLEKKQQQSAKQSEKIIKFATTETSHNIVNDEYKSAKTVEKALTKNKDTESGIQNTYEEFRHRAKAAADAAATLPSIQSAATTATTEKVTSNANNNVDATSEATTHHRHNYDRKATTLSRDHERLFKEFDDLSKQLHQELENSKAEREQREKSASMFDLNRIHMRQKEQIEEFNKTRCEHLRELEQGIERSMRSRSLKVTRPQEANIDVVDHQSGRTYEIPIHIENGNTTTPAASASKKCTSPHDEPPPLPKHPKTYQIPIQMENSNSLCIDDARFRRAESMFNLSDDLNSRQRTYSNQTQYQKHEDDWSKYASDLGSSENIVRPFAKEVAICYQRRPGGIRAPRLTASTNDLSFNNQQCYDQYNAYNVPRQHHAPMLNGAPEQSRPKFGSCYSMIERDPNPKYISTTTRRGISPAPQPTGFFPLDSCHVREEDMRQRRASLPRELHEQQLKYITNKEEELRTEFERLQSERRRLLEEAQKAHAIQMDPTPTSPVAPIRSLQYRSCQKLPTVTEDEVFRQQMAEEWLNKVAEREKRRLQNIIKISKIQEDEAITRHKTDMGEEFLSRVKERRHKLAMPADSDWESGAESQPINQAQHSEAEDIPPMKIIEGEQEANLRGLPRHLREFAKFSNRQRENIEGGHREHHHEEERSEETTDNSVSRAFKKSSVVKTVKTLRAPMLQEKHGHDTKLHYHKSRVHQASARPRDPQLTDHIQRRSNKQTRFATSAKRRSWSESDLLQEIDKDLKLAKGFLFQNEKAQSHSMFAPKFKAKAPTGTGIWSPKNQTPSSSWSNLSEHNKSAPPTPPPPPLKPVWTPQTSPHSSRKEFRPVHFESPTLQRKYVLSTSTEATLPPWNCPNKEAAIPTCLPHNPTNSHTATSVASEAAAGLTRVGSSHSLSGALPKSGISDKIKTFERSASTSDLYCRPQITRTADRGRPFCKPNEVIYKVKHEYMSEPEMENEHPKKMAQLGRRQYDGIGPTTNDGMPIILRSEVKEPHQHEWYKRLYQTIHKQKHGGRNQYSKPNGYLSEPEPNYDSDYSTIKYRTVNPNRLQSVSSALNVRRTNDTFYGTLPTAVKSGYNSYKNQPGRIEDYVTGHSSVSEKEKKEWLKEHAEIETFHVEIPKRHEALRQLDPQNKLSSHYTEGNLSRALAKESGYTSDSNLVFRKKEIPQSSPLSPVEQKQAYKSVQAGGEPPLFGFRKPAPEKSRALETKKTKTVAPPAPPSRKSLYSKSMVKNSTRGIPIAISSSSRHEKCFQRPESPILGVPNKYCTTILRRSPSKVPLYRSKSAGAVEPAINSALESKRAIFRKQTFGQTCSPQRKSLQLRTRRNDSRSPVAFGRSVSKERTFAEEKKRLENSLPLSRYTFEASTNILRDPAMKSPQDVKKAVRTLAACAVQTRSRSMPRFCTGCRTQAHFYNTNTSSHTIVLPYISHYGYTEWIPPSRERATVAKKRKVEKSLAAKQLPKTISNVSLAESNSTYSLGHSPPIGPAKNKGLKTTTNADTSSKICKKLAKEKNRNRKFNTNKKETPTEQNLQEISYVCQRKYTPKQDDIDRNIIIERSLDSCIATVRDKTNFWNDFNAQQSNSLPYVGLKKLLPSNTADEASVHKSRSLSPSRNRLQSEESNQTQTCDSGYIETRDPTVNPEVKEFSPTREVRVAPHLNRNVRSPSRRKIDSCRSNQTNKVIRASSMSSAEDRSQRGLYLCDELAHSATSLASNDRHSPTCRYLRNSERFVELNRFYNTIERVGQLEKSTSKPNFKPIRKESDLLDFEEWRQVRLHERDEKELSYLLNKLKQEQHAQKFLFLPKDVNDVKWRKEHDIGLNSREKSVEDLRENFESINFLQDYIDEKHKPCINMKYWRRNTVADLAQNLEEKFQKIDRNRSPGPEAHFSELVSTLPKDQIRKVNHQLSEIYSYEESKHPIEKDDEKFIVTVERNTMPTSSQALKVRCKSSITRDELLGSVLKKKNALTAINLKKHNNVPIEQTIDNKNVKAADEEDDDQQPPEIPPAPKMDYIKSTDTSSNTRDPKDILERIKFFEERKYDTPSTTIYRAREDSSPDEDEVMKQIEEKMRLKQYRGYSHHKELSNSLTDLCGIFGEKNSSRINFHMLSPQQRPPDEYHDDISETYQRSEDYSPYSSLEFLEPCCHSRSASPQSQCSSYLQRVNTGEVQKIRDKFESLGYENMKQDHFFGLSKLRKVRSDPEVNTIKSESKDILHNGDVSWITHKFEIQNKLLKPIKEEAEPKRGRKRLMLSPTPLTNRLMPHIDRISKTAVLGNIQNKRQKSPSPTRSQSSSSGIVERLKVRYENQQGNNMQTQLSQSSPDIRDNITQYLTANWIAHRYPSPTHNNIIETAAAQKPQKTTTCNHSSPRGKPSKCIRHSKKIQDIFANQKFDPKIHTPKARYVPDAAEIKQKQLPKLQWSPLTPKREHAVTFKDYDFTTPKLPPPPKGELLQHRAVSPHRYYESDVNIHFKTPVRQEYKYHLSEEELAVRQAEHMQKLYQEERRRKYLQELQDMNSRRHTDNFTPSQKSPIPLNRYDDFPADLAPKTTNQIKSVARALYNFQAQNSKELSFKKGDIIYIKRAIDKNWYEGEHNAMIGLFPANYVEIISKESMQPIQAQANVYRKPSEGQARAKYNFQAQSAVELSLNKGELVALTRRVDDNWFEGRIANRKGIFPVSYVEVLTDIGAEDIAARTTTIQQVSVVNARPSLDVLRTNINNEFNSLTRNGNQPSNAILRETRNVHKTDILHVDTSSTPLVYRALYKYRPQNSDELELEEGDIVHVLEKCDDGWYVGTSQRTGCFGTFPGNYVERV